MKDLTIFTIETVGIAGESIRLRTAAYNISQAKAAFAASAYRVNNRDPLMRKVEHMPKSIQKEYAAMIANPTEVFSYEFVTQKWTML